jgi:hypothetical protein
MHLVLRAKRKLGTSRTNLDGYTPPVDKVYRAFLLIADAIEQEVIDHYENTETQANTQTEIAKQLNFTRNEY